VSLRRSGAATVASGGLVHIGRVDHSAGWLTKWSGWTMPPDPRPAVSPAAALPGGHPRGDLRREANPSLARTWATSWAMVVCTHCGLHYVGTAARRQPLPLGNSPPSALRSTRPKPPSTATWAPSRPAPCQRPSAANASKPSAPSLADLQARELELQQALSATATQEPPTTTDLEELASQLRQVIEHAPVTAKKALAQQLVHEIHVTGRDDIRPIFRIPTRHEPSPGEARRFVSWSGRSQPASIRTFHRWLRVQRFD
jgi:hypothetical protein